MTNNLRLGGQWITELGEIQDKLEGKYIQNDDECGPNLMDYEQVRWVEEEHALANNKD